MTNKRTGTGRTAREGAKLAARRTEVFRRWLSGETVRSIGAALVPKLSPSTVCHDVQFALKEWKDEHRASVNALANLEWELLNWVLLECQKNYDLSCDPKMRDKVGDPRFLELAIRSGEQRRKLLGIDKPAKIEAQTTAEVSVSTNFKTLEELKASITKRMQAIEARKKDATKP